jgi:hypothetical protein
MTPGHFPPSENGVFSKTSILGFRLLRISTGAVSARLDGDAVAVQDVSGRCSPRKQPASGQD